jgi:hypothetical protein
MVDLNFWGNILSILASVVTVYISFEIYRYNRLNKSWLAVTTGLFLMVFRRTLGFVADYTSNTGMKAMTKSIETGTLLLISLLLIWGFWSMLKSFQNFDIIQKKAEDKVKNFNNR